MASAWVPLPSPQPSMMIKNAGAGVKVIMLQNYISYFRQGKDDYLIFAYVLARLLCRNGACL